MARLSAGAFGECHRRLFLLFFCKYLKRKMWIIREFLAPLWVPIAKNVNNQRHHLMYFPSFFFFYFFFKKSFDLYCR
jgi:hypothetical protein